ncbi:hypothetical protein Daus18300_005563 [Diaporthe australafricana]|uniref:DUF7730 domain-containing protein n=1 Tax=Diaporthe australafricana TaxID=127596 RepID=A0ABR3X0Y2_9PEZI
MLPNSPRRELSSQGKSVPASSQEQLESPLFSTLPSEIRLQIYQQLWMECGLTQHIFLLSPVSFLQSFPCILSHEELDQPAGVPSSSSAEAEEEDQQHQSQYYDDPGDIDGAYQDLALQDTAVYNPPPGTPWCMHCPCHLRWTEKWANCFVKQYSASYIFKKGAGRDWQDLRSSPMLALLLVCKRVHLEASDSLFSNIRFSFSGMHALNTFLEQVPRPLVSRIRFVDIMSGHVGCLFRNPKSTKLNVPPTKEVRQTLKAAFPKLKELRLTLYSGPRGRAIPSERALKPLYKLAREMDSLRKFEVFLPVKCKAESKISFDEAHASLPETPLRVTLVPHGWHDDKSECQCYTG